MNEYLVTVSDAINIFKLKGPSSSAADVGRTYGASEKAIRDIWKGRTWARDTWHLDMSRAYHFKQVGRPIGSKDKKPRIIRAIPRVVPALFMSNESDLSRAAPTCPCSSYRSIGSAMPEVEASMQSWSVDAGTILDDLLFHWEMNPGKYLCRSGEQRTQDWDSAFVDPENQAESDERLSQ